MKRRKDGRFAKKITVNGKQIFLYSSAETERKAEKDFQNQMLEFRETKIKTTTTIESLAYKVLEDKKLKSHKTIECYENAFKKISSLAERNIEDIVPTEWQLILNDLKAKKYSKSSISKVKTFIGLIYNKAILSGINVTNPTRSLVIERENRKYINPPQKEEVDIIRQSKTDFSLWAKFLLYTGIRPQELNALQFKDVKDNKINVYKACEYPNNQAIIKTTKTESGKREIPIPNVLLKEIPKGKTNNYIFGGSHPYSKGQIRKKWDKFKKENNINCTQYQLRHEYALSLCKANVPIKTAQYLLGHSDFATTMNIYTQFDNEIKNSATDKINSFFDSI